MKPRPIRTCAIYSRVSTREQQPENQLEQLRTFAGKQGWTITAEYVDVESGASSKRPQFQRLMQAASRRECDVVLFWALDRFSREGAAQTFQYLEQLRSWGATWHDFTNPLISGTSPYADVIIAISAVIAKLERERISDRTKAGLQRAQKQGKRLGRPRCVVDVQDVQRRMQLGESITAIARRLKVSRTTIQRRILNPARLPL